ncbi:MAG: aminotransferase, partial [Deltaproteobacteria bacterium]
MRLVLEELKEFSKDKQWLAALAEEGHVFDSVDPEDEQLIRALKRFPTEDIKLLTRDTLLLKKYPDKAISPERYCQIDKLDKSLNFIDLKAQQRSIRPALEKNIHRVLHHGRYIMGPEVKELETRLCNYTGAKHCIGVSSGTDALLMPLMAMDIGPGDAVFTTPFTFIATAEVIRLLGATPVFVDIDPGTFNLDPGKLASAIEAVRKNDPAIYPLPQQTGPLSPKAVMPVDLFGLPADYDPIMALAEAHGLKVLSDSAQGFGSVYKERKSGTLGHATATSFFPAKPLGAYGDGGAIFTDDEDLAARLESIRVHGKGTDKYDNIRIGLNARLDTLQAAILLAKMEIYPREVQLRQEVAKRYTDLLSTQSSALSTPFVPEGMKSAWAQYSLLARDQDLR